MSLEEKFNKLTADWKRHCRRNKFHSFAEPYLKCKVYRELVSMGPEILPLIREEYSKPQQVGDPGQFWCYLIKEIAPEFKISITPEGAVKKVAEGFVGVDVDKVREFTLKWLDENIEKLLVNPDKT